MNEICAMTTPIQPFRFNRKHYEKDLNLPEEWTVIMIFAKFGDGNSLKLRFKNYF